MRLVITPRLSQFFYKSELLFLCSYHAYFRQCVRVHQPATASTKDELNCPYRSTNRTIQEPDSIGIDEDNHLEEAWSFTATVQKSTGVHRGDETDSEAVITWGGHRWTRTVWWQALLDYGCFHLLSSFNILSLDLSNHAYLISRALWVAELLTNEKPWSIFETWSVCLTSVEVENRIFRSDWDCCNWRLGRSLVMSGSKARIIERMPKSKHTVKIIEVRPSPPTQYHGRLPYRPPCDRAFSLQSIIYLITEKDSKLYKM